jgi:hypothetical protein
MKVISSDWGADPANNRMSSRRASPISRAGRLLFFVIAAIIRSSP